ncbi:MAG: AI-2E family transporter [Ignavibacteriales bacterium]|jgi:predicted PurR-regulated permease PerM|nr:AI-2E family transporter [Ignavibacteriaceae bacterium]NLH60967.1 AI-2E family transporter [Ignavibacteriales bacterium]HOJ17757.1 AI-2E family transporter [Ignavibacteriaceae bacterium]HPO56440.1 AI-2E family transporter [Ignavibacteriaceae bacterium]
MAMSTDMKLTSFRKYFLTFLILAAVAYFTYLFAYILGIVFISILLATLFDPVISYLESKGIKRLFATLLTFLSVLLLFYFLLASFIPKLATQFDSFMQTFRHISLQENIAALEKEVKKILPFLPDSFLYHKIELIITKGIDSSFYALGQSFSGLFAAVALLVILPFTTFFIAKDKFMLLKGLVSLFPNNSFEMSYTVVKRVTDKLSHYVRGWIIDAAFVGIACGIGFWIIGIENSIILGLIAGIGHLIPYLGPIIGGIPALLISIVQFGNISALPAIVIVVLFIYTMDNGFVQPYVFSKNVDIHPLFIILIIIGGGELFGITGMLFAVPAVTIIRTAIKEYYFARKNFKLYNTA